jgi:NIPSNAP
MSTGSAPSGRGAAATLPAGSLHGRTRRSSIPGMIYEYRAYYALPGRMPDIQKRFADVTMKLFAKHGIKVIGFWDTVVGENNELVYICAFNDLAHREKAWAAFQADPEWQAARKASEANGPLLEKVINKIWKPTPFSPIQ